MKILCIAKKLKLNNIYKENANKVLEIKEKIDVLENNLNYIDESLLKDYIDNLKILNEKYNKLLKKLKTIDKEYIEII